MLPETSVIISPSFRRTTALRFYLVMSFTVFWKAFQSSVILRRTTTNKLLHYAVDLVCPICIVSLPDRPYQCTPKRFCLSSSRSQIFFLYRYQEGKDWKWDAWSISTGYILCALLPFFGEPYWVRSCVIHIVELCPRGKHPISPSLFCHREGIIKSTVTHLSVISLVKETDSGQ